MPRILRIALLLALALTPLAGRATDFDMRAFVEAFLQRETRQIADKVTIEIKPNALPRNAQDCPHPEAFLAPGRRAWGSTVVGVRCDEPRWTLYIPARVHVEGAYLTAARPLAAGTVLAPADWTPVTGDVAAQPAGVLRTPEQAGGATLRVAVAAGAALRADQLLVVSAVQRGQKVKVVYRGEGFEVANEGTALTAAAEGQNVQVRLTDGRTIQGIARSGGLVEVLH